MKSVPTRLAVAAVVAMGIFVLAPSPALAVGGGGDSGSTTEVLFLLLLIGAAYLLTHFVVGRLQRAFLVVSGLEYILLGVLLGPAVAIVPTFEGIDRLLPVVALATGWVGLLRGMELSVSVLSVAARGTRRLAFGDNLFAGGLVAVGAFFLFQAPWFSPVDERQAWLVSVALGACAATRGTAPLEVVGRRYHVEGPTTPLLRLSARIGDAISLFIFGLLFAIFHDHPETAALNLRDGEWAVFWVALAITLGLVLGVFFRPFLGKDDSENARFLALVGIITFAAGAGWFLELSPLFITLVLGVVLVNTSPAGARIYETLERTERPMSLILFLFAGALWTIPPLWQTLALFPAFILVRFIGKWISSRLAASGGLLRHDLYRGHIAHGDAAVAMAISFKLVFVGPAIDIVYTVVLASVVLHDLIAPRVARSLLVDSGEVRRELGI